MTPPKSGALSWTVVRECIREKIPAILCFAVVLLLPAALVLALNFLKPVSLQATQELRVLLPRDLTQTNQLHYPNGNVFNKLDIIAPTVLENVYRQNGLERYMTFPDFQRVLVIENQDLDQQRVNAEYAQKLRARNLTAIDIDRLEAQYRGALAQLDVSRLNLGIILEFGAEKMPQSLIDRLLGAVPEAWFDVYRVLEGRRLPQMGTENLEEVTLQYAETSLFQASDFLEQKIRQIRECLREYARLLGDRSLLLPTGESIDMLQQDLANLENYQLTIIRQALTAHGSLGTSLDPIYVQGRIQALNRDKTQLENEMRGIMESLSILGISSEGGARPSAGAAGPEAAAGSGGGVAGLGGSAMTPALEMNVFNAIVAMANENQNSATRRDMVARYQAFNTRLSVVEANLSFYAGAAAGGGDSLPTTVDAALVRARLAEAAAKLQAVNLGAQTFLGLIEDDFRTTFRYYAPTGVPYTARELALSPLKAIAAIAALYALALLAFAALSVFLALPKPAEDEEPARQQ